MVIQNLIDNIKDQNQEDTVTEYALVFNFKRSACSKTKGIEYLLKRKCSSFIVHEEDYTHEVRNEAKGSLEI